MEERIERFRRELPVAKHAETNEPVLGGMRSADGRLASVASCDLLSEAPEKQRST
jgi:hypothetical protein